jgi:SOS-response transcriptional repressor LexA
MRTQRVTTTREKIFAFIITHKATHDGNSPTTREIADAINLGSTSTVFYHLTALERAGKISISRMKTRQITVVGGHWTFRPPTA